MGKIVISRMHDNKTNKHVGKHLGEIRICDPSEAQFFTCRSDFNLSETMPASLVEVANRAFVKVFFALARSYELAHAHTYTHRSSAAMRVHVRATNISASS